METASTGLETSAGCSINRWLYTQVELRGEAEACEERLSLQMGGCIIEVEFQGE